ncbi:MAG TPA: PIN domain-containing protein [Thermomicrobiales bacterium]|jgi:predicted nucleic acid-binding protein
METDQQTGPGRKRGRRERTGGAKLDPGSPVAFVDSSAIVALVDRDDRTHAAAVEAYRSLVGSGYRLFTTNHVVVEVYDLLYAGIGPEVARRWLHEHRLAIYTTDEDDEEKARAMVTGGSADRPMTLTDAISIVVMERLGVADAFAVDPHFLAALA